MITFNTKKIISEFKRINKNIAKIEDIATTRTLNKILDDERREIANEVSAEYGVLKGSAKSHIKPVRATRNNKEIKLIAASTRSNVVSPRQIKGGISFRKKGGGRAKIKTKVNGGSKPFMIKAKAGGIRSGDDIKVKGGLKKVPVYVPKGLNKYKNIARRKVKTFLGSSIKVMIEELQIKSKRLRHRLKRDFPVIYKKQLKKAKFTGKR